MAGRIRSIIGRCGLATVVACGASLALVGTPAAEAQARQDRGMQERRATQYRAVPQRETLMLLTRRITIDFEDQRLEDIVNFISELTGAEIEPEWRTDLDDGLDPDMLITMRVRNLPALTVIERVLERAQTGFAENAWQMSEWGSLEIGPKDRLNRRKRLEVYDINDLLMEFPQYDDAPQIDLQSVLQASQRGGGGGGGQNPFEQVQDQQEERRTRDERIQDVIDLLQTFVEFEQWVDNGGDGADVRVFQGQLLIRAPDYIHRQINGYPYWPSHTVRFTEGNRRYVGLNMDVGIGTVDGFATERVFGPGG